MNWETDPNRFDNSKEIEGTNRALVEKLYCKQCKKIFIPETIMTDKGEIIDQTTRFCPVYRKEKAEWENKNVSAERLKLELSELNERHTVLTYYEFVKRKKDSEMAKKLFDSRYRPKTPGYLVYEGVIGSKPSSSYNQDGITFVQKPTPNLGEDYQDGKFNVSFKHGVVYELPAELMERYSAFRGFKVVESCSNPDRTYAKSKLEELKKEKYKQKIIKV